MEIIFPSSKHILEMICLINSSKSPIKVGEWVKDVYNVHPCCGPGEVCPMQLGLMAGVSS
jgi:hypothetical protein